MAEAALSESVALLRAVPALAMRLPWARIGTWPTAVERLAALEPIVGGPLYVKRDDLSAVRYGGNKVRALEPVLGDARARGASRLATLGAYGSNHVLATVLFGREAGLDPEVTLYPQPFGPGARDTLAATLSLRPRLHLLRGWAGIPLALLRGHLGAPYFVPPGGACALGCLGFASAALELAGQVRAGLMPPPDRIVVALGTGGSAAGLLVGITLGLRLGLALPGPPEVWAVSVVPWPVASAYHVLALAESASELCARLAGEPRLRATRSELAAPLRVVADHLGGGYGHPTADGLDAIERFRDAGGPPLDPVYSGKAAASLFRGRAHGVTLFWATKSSRPLPPPDPAALDAAPERLRRWMAGA